MGEKTEGMETVGRAKVPPIAGPMMVPMDQTNGITAYAFAVERQHDNVVYHYGFVGVTHAHAPAS